MGKASILGGLALAGIMAMPLTNYAQERTGQDTKNRLEDRIPDLEKELTTREDYLNKLKQILGPKYEAIKKDPYLKKRWDRNWEDAPAKRLKAVVNLYNPKLNPVPPKEVLDKRFEEMSALNFGLILNYFFWIEYGEHGEKLTLQEKAIFIQYDRDLKELWKYRATRSK